MRATHIPRRPKKKPLRGEKVGFAEKKLRLCLAGLPCMAMPVQVGALRGGRKILRPYKWEEIEGIGYRGYSSYSGYSGYRCYRCYSDYRGCRGVGVGVLWVWGRGMDLLKLNNMLIFVD